MKLKIEKSPNNEIKEQNRKNSYLILLGIVVFTIIIFIGVINIFITNRLINIGTIFLFGVFSFLDIIFIGIFYMIYPEDLIIQNNSLQYVKLGGLIKKSINFKDISYGVLFIDNENVYSLGLFLKNETKFLFHGNVHSNEFNVHLKEILINKAIKVSERKVETVLIWNTDPEYSIKKVV